MKKTALSLIAMMVAMFSFAQQVLVATLTHDGETTMFYGVDAFAKAHEAAENGDIINLSPGNFDPTTITKAVTIRGTGIDEPNHTFIGFCHVAIPETEEYLNIEGCEFIQLRINSPLKNARFFKSIIRVFDTYYYGKSINNCTFTNCKIAEYMDLYSNSSVAFFNCFINNYSTIDISSTTKILNCVVHSDYGSTFTADIANSIIIDKGNNYLNSAVLANCAVILVNKDDAFSSAASAQNCKIATFDIFKDSDFFNDLTDEAKAQYLGLDGTPVGMYGGSYPFNTTPSYPRITKFVVDGKVNDEGKLNVDIEIANPE